MTPLVAAVLQLRAEQAGPWPANAGEVGHALALRLIEEVDAALAASLHGGNGLPPYTACLLRAGGRRGSVSAEEAVTLRLTAVGDGLAERLCEAALPAWIGRTVSIAGTPFRVEAAAATAAEHPLAAMASYEELAQQHLFTRRSDVRLPAFRFITPTAFRSGGRVTPLPVPELVFGSLLDRWDAFAPLTIPREARRFAAECVAIGGLQIDTEYVSVAGGRVTGFTGWVRFAVTHRDPFWLGMLNLLAAFAPWAGVGMKTAMGMGQVRLLVPRQSAAQPSQPTGNPGTGQSDDEVSQTG